MHHDEATKQPWLTTPLSILAPPAANAVVVPKRRRKQRALSLAGFFFVTLTLFGVVNLTLHGRGLPSVRDDLQMSGLINSKQSLENSLFSNDKKRLQNKNEKDPITADQKQLDYKQQQQQQQHTRSALAGLSCEQFGGPGPDAAQEMAYWQDIPADSLFVSPFRQTSGSSSPKYLTFEPDSGGWNNIRMGLETAIGLAFSMGRTLVLPPEKHLYLLRQETSKDGTKQRDSFTFAHFFHTDDIDKEHLGLDIISMDEFLKREALTGHFRDEAGQPVFTQGNRTNWDGAPEDIFLWLRNHARLMLWDVKKCIAVVPASTDSSDFQTLVDMEASLQNENLEWQQYIGNPVPVNASTYERLKENWCGRKKFCFNDQNVQAAPVVHFPGGSMPNHAVNLRLLVHFYVFLFFQDWRHDLWLKRFIRDHIRYADEIQCAAARIVAAVRAHARQKDPTGNPQGLFDALHIRRGDFQYTDTRVSADKIYEQTSKVLSEHATVYIATDERDKRFFDLLKQHYDVVFLDDFMAELGVVNTNFFGMVDALIASKSRNFFGCWFSTFTGYINRIRGYHADKNKEPGHEKGIIKSWYYAHADKFDQMSVYYPLKPALWTREFPTSWRLLNTGLEEFHRKEGLYVDQ